MVGDPGNSTVGWEAGCVELFGVDRGLASGPSSELAALRLHGEEWDDLGDARSVASGSDLDGDGSADLAGGAPYTDGLGNARGTSCLFYGPSTGVLNVFDTEANMVGVWEEGRRGTAMAVGDYNADGLPDLLSSSPGDDLIGVRFGSGQ